MEKQEKYKDDSFLFLEFAKEHGFKPRRNEQILELFHGASDSVSKYLTKECKPFLLSKKVQYDELDDFDLIGAKGRLEEMNGILISKSDEGKRYFRQHDIVLKPWVDDFNSLIAYENHNFTKTQLKQILLAQKFAIPNIYI